MFLGVIGLTHLSLKGGRLTRILFSLVPSRLKLRWLFPDKEDCPASSDQSLRVFFSWGEDENFARVLDELEENNIDFCVAAVPEAIHIKNGELAKVVGKKYADYLEQRELERRMRTADPIIYLLNEERTHAAIIAQTGDYPKEKELIEWARTVDLEEIYG